MTLIYSQVFSVSISFPRNSVRCKKNPPPHQPRGWISDPQEAPPYPAREREERHQESKLANVREKVGAPPPKSGAPSGDQFAQGGLLGWETASPSNQKIGHETILGSWGAKFFPKNEKKTSFAKNGGSKLFPQARAVPHKELGPALLALPRTPRTKALPEDAGEQGIGSQGPSFLVGFPRGSVNSRLGGFHDGSGRFERLFFCENKVFFFFCENKGLVSAGF